MVYSSQTSSHSKTNVFSPNLFFATQVEVVSEKQKWKQRAPENNQKKQYK